jgi:hypothetical protein
VAFSIPIGHHAVMKHYQGSLNLGISRISRLVMSVEAAGKAG